MTKATYRRKVLFGLTVPEGEESIILTEGEYGSRQAWWLGQQLRARILNYEQEAQGVVRNLETSKPTLSDTLPPAKPHLLSLTKQCHQSVQMLETIKVISPFPLMDRFVQTSLYSVRRLAQ